MQRTYHQLDVRQFDQVFCVHLRGQCLLEDGLDELSAELARLIDEEGCQKLVLDLGPGDLDCLYSVFLAKLINLQRRLEHAGGCLAIAGASENTRDVFRATGLEKHFQFFPDAASAVRALGERPA
jgi:anti-anti-sigma factor